MGWCQSPISSRIRWDSPACARMRAANCWSSGAAVCPVTVAARAVACPSRPSILVVKVISAVLKAVGVAA
jgi:hypothetical protein